MGRLQLPSASAARRSRKVEEIRENTVSGELGTKESNGPRRNARLPVHRITLPANKKGAAGAAPFWKRRRKRAY
jgi:hypothetical protein